MRYLLCKFRKASITKQYLALLLCSFLIILLLSFLILFQARQAVIQTGNEFASMFSSVLSTELSAISTQAMSICEQLLYDANATSLLEASNWSEVEVRILDQIRVQKAYFNEANPNIADISFFSPLINWTSLYNEESQQNMPAAVKDAGRPDNER